MSIFSRLKKKGRTESGSREEKIAGPAEQSGKATPATPAAPSRPRGAAESIRWPLLSEKATTFQASNKYVFVVPSDATKTEIKKEIARLFDVKVRKVGVVNRKSKSRMWRGRRGRRPGYKKAIVTVEAGKKIEILPT